MLNYNTQRLNFWIFSSDSKARRCVPRIMSWHWLNSPWAPVESPLRQVQRAVDEKWDCCFCDFYKPFTFLFVWTPLRVPVLVSISRKKQSLIWLYISICFVVISSQLARPERRLNWDIFSRKCVILTPCYSLTNEAQRGKMSRIICKTMGVMVTNTFCAPSVGQGPHPAFTVVKD